MLETNQYNQFMGFARNRYADVKKFGIAGTSSSGKTTLTYKALYTLKRAGVLCDGVLQQDRRFSFDRSLLETDVLAQWSFIANQIKAEADMAMRPGVDVLVSDRTPLDLYAYYVATHGSNITLEHTVFQWCEQTFEKIFVLSPVAYEKDGVRPSEDFRDKVHQVLMSLCMKYRRSNLMVEPTGDDGTFRKSALSTILASAGKLLKDADLAIIAAALEQDVLIGGSYAFNRANKYSDVDVYIMAGTVSGGTLEKNLQSILGVKVEPHIVPNEQVWNYLKEQGFKEYKYAKVSEE